MVSAVKYKQAQYNLRRAWDVNHSKRSTCPCRLNAKDVVLCATDQFGYG